MTSIEKLWLADLMIKEAGAPWAELGPRLLTGEGGKMINNAVRTLPKAEIPDMRNYAATLLKQHRAANPHLSFRGEALNPPPEEMGDMAAIGAGTAGLGMAAYLLNKRRQQNQQQNQPFYKRWFQ
jgi:hypothetical protein